MRDIVRFKQWIFSPENNRLREYIRQKSGLKQDMIQVLEDVENKHFALCGMCDGDEDGNCPVCINGYSGL